MPLHPSLIIWPFELFTIHCQVESWPTRNLAILPQHMSGEPSCLQATKNAGWAASFSSVPPV